MLASAIKNEIGPFVGQAAVAAAAGTKKAGRGKGGRGGGGVSFSSSSAAVAAAAAAARGGGGGGVVHPFFQSRAGASAAAARAAVASVVAAVAGREGGREGGSAIVYCWKTADCDLLAAELTRRGIPTKAYHAKIKKREEVQRLFCEGVIKVVTASCAFGMGIDKADVRLVVHWTVTSSSLPPSLPPSIPLLPSTLEAFTYLFSPSSSFQSLTSIHPSLPPSPRSLIHSNNCVKKAGVRAATGNQLSPSSFLPTTTTHHSHPSLSLPPSLPQVPNTLEASIRRAAARGGMASPLSPSSFIPTTTSGLVNTCLQTTYTHTYALPPSLPPSLPSLGP